MVMDLLPVWHIMSVYLWYAVQHYEPAKREKHKIVCLATMSPEALLFVHVLISVSR